MMLSKLETCLNPPKGRRLVSTVRVDCDRPFVKVSQSPEGAAPGFDGIIRRTASSRRMSQSPEGAAPGFDEEGQHENHRRQ